MWTFSAIVPIQQNVLDLTFIFFGIITQTGSLTTTSVEGFTSTICRLRMSTYGLEDCAQLVKANSIVGSKRNTVDVVYTPWSNLKKTNAMDVGQVDAPQRLRMGCS